MQLSEQSVDSFVNEHLRIELLNIKYAYQLEMISLVEALELRKEVYSRYVKRYHTTDSVHDQETRRTT